VEWSEMAGDTMQNARFKGAVAIVVHACGGSVEGGGQAFND